MNAIKVIIFLIFCSSVSFGQVGVGQVQSARVTGLGGAAAAITGAESIMSNPAGIAWTNGFSALLSSERRFLIPDLIGISMGITKEVGATGMLGLSINHVGFDTYAEQQIALLYARKLSDRIALGANIKYYLFNLDDYGQTSAFTFEVGLQTKISEELSLGVHVANPAQISIGENSELETQFSIGMAYTPSAKVNMLFDVKKTLAYDPSFHLGVEYQLQPNFVLRAGGQANPSAFTIGIGYAFGGKWKVDGSFSEHNTLGSTPGMSFSYQNPVEE